jgi:hypothetical protein
LVFFVDLKTDVLCAATISNFFQSSSSTLSSHQERNKRPNVTTLNFLEASFSDNVYGFSPRSIRFFLYKSTIASTDLRAATSFVSFIHEILE